MFLFEARMLISYLFAEFFNQKERKHLDTYHQLLNIKLRSIGVSENSLKWFNLYLNDRSQVTSIGCTLSATAPLSVGVPKGSILGPLLFLHLCQRSDKMSHSK